MNLNKLSTLILSAALTLASCADKEKIQLETATVMLATTQKAQDAPKDAKAVVWTVRGGKLYPVAEGSGAPASPCR